MNLISHPWNIVFLLGFAVYLGIRHVFERRTRGNKKKSSRIDGLEKALLGIVVLGSLVAPVLYLMTSWLSFADYDLPALIPWCGTAVMLTALWLFWRSHSDLGQNWSVSLEIREEHELVTGGVYRAMRHPMYASIWLWSLSQAMLLENWLAGGSALVTFAPLYFVRAPREESMMCEFFGDEYRVYMRRTGRIFPRVVSDKDQVTKA
jgi:protein-S-isoprenylcysteine O-methyltransferase Ste14